MLLFSHAGRTEFQKKAFCLLPDGSTDDKEEPSNPFKQLQFLVGELEKGKLEKFGNLMLFWWILKFIFGKKKIYDCGETWKYKMRHFKSAKITKME